MAGTDSKEELYLKQGINIMHNPAWQSISDLPLATIKISGAPAARKQLNSVGFRNVISISGLLLRAAEAISGGLLLTTSHSDI